MILVAEKTVLTQRPWMLETRLSPCPEVAEPGDLWQDPQFKAFELGEAVAIITAESSDCRTWTAEIWGTRQVSHLSEAEVNSLSILILCGFLEDRVVAIQLEKGSSLCSSLRLPC